MSLYHGTFTPANFVKTQKQTLRSLNERTMKDSVTQATVDGTTRAWTSLLSYPSSSLRTCRQMHEDAAAMTGT